MRPVARFGQWPEQLRQLALTGLLQASLPMYNNLEEAVNAIRLKLDDPYDADAVAAAAREVGKGQGLGNSLAASRVFPDLPIQMITVGEETGKLDDMLKHVSMFRNVHLHNNEGQWDQHNVIDEGTADLGKVVSVLRSSYSGNLVIESTDLGPGVRSKAVLERLLDDGPAP